MRRSTVVAGTTLIALIGGGATLLPAAANPGAVPSHTMTFTSVTKRTVDFSVSHPAYQAHAAQLDVDVSAGKVIGYDTTNVSFDGKTQSGHGWVAINLRSGFIYLSLHLAKTITGKVIGGTGRYSHATGTATVVDLNKSGTRATVTITYKH
jgi:hypothetical protein